jgi:hypothetical protein
VKGFGGRDGRVSLSLYAREGSKDAPRYPGSEGILILRRKGTDDGCLNRWGKASGSTLLPCNLYPLTIRLHDPATGVTDRTRPCGYPSARRAASAMW